MNKLSRLWAFLQQFERYLFVLAVVLVTHEVFARAWLANEDGPAHIYNSVVARELFFHPDSPLSEVFQLNHVIVPNCLGHLILAVCTSFTSFETSEKILHLIIVIGFCFSFRFLSTRINPDQPFYSWLGFPFVYSATLFMGFDNFCLGIVLFMLTTATWIWAETRSRKFWPILLIILLGTLLFLTHLIPFLLFILVIGMRILTHFFVKAYRTFFIQAGLLTLTILPAGILFVKYIIGRTEAGINRYIWADWTDTLYRLINIRFLAMHNFKQEPWASFLSIFLLSMGSLSIILFFRNKKTNTKEEIFRFRFWGISVIILLILLFAAPNDFGGSGDLTFRLLHIFWIFFILFLASGKLPQPIVVSIAAVSLSVTFVMISIRKDVHWELNNYSKQVMRMAPYISEYSTGIYVPIATNWPILHVGELAFAEKKSLLLSNYETVHDFFPLLWQKEFPYNYKVGGLASQDLSCWSCYWPAQKNKPEKQIDYVLICKMDIRDSACYSQLTDTLQKYYYLKKTDEPFYLYEHNGKK